MRDGILAQKVAEVIRSVGPSDEARQAALILKREAIRVGMQRWSKHQMYLCGVESIGPRSRCMLL